MDAVNFIEAINVFAHSHQDKSKKIFLLDGIPEAVLKRHQKQYADIAPGEQVLLVANDWKITVGMNITGLVVTEKYVYFRCLEDSDYSELSGKMYKGKIPVDSVTAVSVDDRTTTHRGSGSLCKLTVNGKDIGLLLFSDDNAANELDFIFKAAIKGVAYKGNSGKKSAAAAAFGKNVTAYKKTVKTYSVIEWTIIIICMVAAGLPGALNEWSGFIIGLMAFGGIIVGLVISTFIESKVKRFFFRLYK